MSADANDRMKCSACAHDMFSTIWHCSKMESISCSCSTRADSWRFLKRPVRVSLAESLHGALFWVFNHYKSSPMIDKFYSVYFLTHWLIHFFKFYPINRVRNVVLNWNKQIIKKKTLCLSPPNLKWKIEEQINRVRRKNKNKIRSRRWWSVKEQQQSAMSYSFNRKTATRLCAY